MAPPVVIHCMASWGIPSERFVVDLVRSMTVTRPVVACGEVVGRPSTAPLHVPITPLRPVVGRLPERHQTRVLRGLIGAIAVRRRARLLHSHFGYWADHTAAAAQKLRLPWVLSLHGYDVLVKAVREPDRVHTADLVIVPSRFLAAEAAARGFPEARIRVIPSGIDVDTYTYRPRRPRPDGSVRVVFAGRFAPKKGVLDAARAMAVARSKHPNLACSFVGYGPQEAELRSVLLGLRLPARIIDGRPVGAVRQALDDADLLLTASRTTPDGDAESLGLVNIEAQMCGLPVVTTRHGGIPEAVSPDGAIMVPEGDVGALGTALADLAHSPDRWLLMGAAGHEHVRRTFRLADRAREVEECYLELIST